MAFDLDRASGPTKDAMQWLVLATAYFVLALFLIGVLDLLIGLVRLFTTGRFTDPLAVVELLDTVLLLLIIVEVHRTLLAYVRDEPVVRIVLGAAIIAIAREIISFRVDDFEVATDVLAGAAALGLLLVALIATYVLVHRIEPDEL